MTRTLPALLAAGAAALALAACGADGTTSDSHVSADAAKAGIERAARVELVSEPVPDEAAEQGLRASYSNAATVAKDRQAVALFLLDDPRAAKKVKRARRRFGPVATRADRARRGPRRLRRGRHRSRAQVEKAVQALATPPRHATQGRHDEHKT